MNKFKQSILSNQFKLGVLVLKLSTKIWCLTGGIGFSMLGFEAQTNEQVVSKSSTSSHQTKGKVLHVKINTLDDINDLFQSLNYTDKDWQEGNREVPRITFDSVGERWHHSSKNLPVNVKKEIFFRVMGPLVLMSNESILKERALVREAELGSPALKSIAIKYHVLKSDNQKMTETKRKALLHRVDIMPPSLVLAQAAKESGWGTSRFTIEGNAFFGQWDFSGKGMKPKKQRKALGNYGLARFESPLASVEGYMLNINTTGAYKKLRQLRAKLRDNKTEITGLVLADTLDKYSERGQAYINEIKSMIRYNQLQLVDNAYLSDSNIIHLIQ